MQTLYVQLDGRQNKQNVFGRIRHSEIIKVSSVAGILPVLAGGVAEQDDKEEPDLPSLTLLSWKLVMRRGVIFKSVTHFSISIFRHFKWHFLLCYNIWQTFVDTEYWTTELNIKNNHGDFYLSDLL